MTTKGSDYRVEHRISELSPPTAHYSDAVSYGGLIYISGLLPIDGNGSLVGGDDVIAQATQVFRNIRATLDQAGSTIDDILKITVFVTSIQDRGKIDTVRQAALGMIKPASTLIEISALAIPGAKIEIEAVAAHRT